MIDASQLGTGWWGSLLLLQGGADETGKSLLRYIAAGGSIGFIIILISFAGVGLTAAQLIRVRERRLAPAEAVAELDRLLREGSTNGALAFCNSPENDSFLTRVVGAALDRCARSPFGFLELRSALEEAGQQQVARLYRATDGIGLIASVAPMLGLLGTVVGMVGAFDTITLSEGPARPDELAGNISQALVTTVLGLIVAIPATAMYTFMRNRIDTLVADVGGTIELLASHVEGVGQTAPGGAEQRPPTAGVTTG